MSLLITKPLADIDCPVRITLQTIFGGTILSQIIGRVENAEVWCWRAGCSPVQNVPPDISPQCKLSPLSAECRPILVVLARTHEGVMKRKSPIEVSNINESSMKDDLGQFMTACRILYVQL